MLDEQVEPYAPAVRKLLKGVVYHDDPVWSQIRNYELPIREYLGKIGLGLHLDEIWNFAYIFDESRDDDAQTALPALTTRRSLNFMDTLLLVLLRERLDEHEMRDLDGESLLLREEDMMDMLSVFLGDHPDARKIVDSTTTSINRLKRYGFLTDHRSGRYTVRPLLRAKINADELDGLKVQLSKYVQSGIDTDQDDDEPI